MAVIQSLLAVLRFLLELCLVAAYWSFGFTFPGIAGVILGIGLPAMLIAMWALFVAPMAPRRLLGNTRLLLESALFLLGTGALAAIGLWPWGVLLFVIFVLDRVLLEWFGKPAWATPASR